MSEPLEDQLGALRTLVGMLIRQNRDAIARCEALRAILVSRHVFPQDEYDRVYGEALAEWDRAMGAALVDAMKESNAASIQRLFEGLEGKPQ
jgi:hypothetical protein